MTLKPGVRVLGIKPETVVALMVAQSVHDRLGTLMTVTSVVEGKHSRGSIHYAGHAFDLRTNHMRPETAKVIADSLREQLAGDFDVILEKDHLHVEFQPKEAL